jgi:hypothetical protein
LTGRSTRASSGIAPQGVLASIRLAAQCHCVPVNSDVDMAATANHPGFAGGILQWWPAAPLFLVMVAGYLSGDAEIVVSLFLFDLFPGYSAWCAFGVLLALLVPKPLDRIALWSNLVVGVLTGIPFALISMGVAHLHF